MESIEISLNGAELQGALGKIVRAVGPWYKYILPSYFLTLFKKSRGEGALKQLSLPNETSESNTSHHLQEMGLELLCSPAQSLPWAWYCC